MDYKSDTPDLSTPEQAKRVLTEVHRAARELRDENGNLRADVERMAIDLKSAQQALVEARKAMVKPSSRDSEMNRYVTEKGISWTGKETARGYVHGLLDDTPRS